MEELILAKLEEMNQKISNLEENMNKKFEEMDKKFEAIERRFEEIDKRFEAIERKFEEIDKRFEAIDKKFEEIDKKFDAIVNEIDEKIMHRMFAFENEYGRKFNIVFEHLNSEYKVEKNRDDIISILKHKEFVNTSFIRNHEDRISRLEDILDMKKMKQTKNL